MYDDNEIAVEICLKFDSFVKTTCHQCSGVGDIDLWHLFSFCFEKHKIMWLSFVEQTPRVKSKASWDIVSKVNPSQLRVRTWRGKLEPQKSEINT